ncbi:hypothetical protein CQW49_16750 [Methylosinus trichosporium OB3b]|uniref:Uncharacterized protein n=1 Tax=Methylosinus trichosporium (strain ATCC 35070 / NCIMB 11131 / UNIQEM 75 / OB3b) TaxID=595536 RepID=A0A2D2D316_METT3|nr:hypothetical protein CQW49_16750 [Methylosinus trichosporium OB3b]OBS52863.1 hypothetical protein A8B73_08160 [Methylosinus sp. 3S-1]
MALSFDGAAPGRFDDACGQAIYASYILSVKDRDDALFQQAQRIASRDFRLLCAAPATVIDNSHDVTRIAY